MTIFKYKAIDNHGSYVKGRLDAANEPDLEARLGNMGLELLTLNEVKESASSFGRKRVTRQDLINFCFHMEQMTRAGVPILEALQDLRDSHDNAHFREIISAVAASIEGGKTFSEALRQFPKVFDNVFVSLVQAGEQSGKLDRVLKNMTESLKWQDELIAKTKKLIMYPAFVGTVVMLVVFFLMIYLVPQMVGFIKNMGHQIPFHTRALIAVSNFFVYYWYVVLLTPIVSTVLIKLWAKKNPMVRYRIDQAKLHVWVIGPILRKIILARFATYFALLYRSGVTVMQSLSICEQITGNTVIKNALEQVGKNTSEGMNLSQSIEHVGLFPPLVLRMLRVGEHTGRLDDALENVSYFYNRDVRESIERMQTMIEPAMTVVLGLILGWVMLSVLGPIYDIITKIKL